MSFGRFGLAVDLIEAIPDAVEIIFEAYLNESNGSFERGLLFYAYFFFF